MFSDISSEMTCLDNAVLMLGHRLRCWPDIKKALAKRVMFAGVS